MIYNLIKNLLFLLPPEAAHQLTMQLLNSFHPLIPNNYFQPNNPQSKNIFGLTFSNSVGLAAGFDKNAEYLESLTKLGFGFIEVGTVTPKAQIGNPKPRMLRLPSQQALINRMGFNNKGIDLFYQNIHHYKNKYPNNSCIIGANIGKNKDTPIENAVEDYKICFNKIHSIVDYIVINVSSPNTPNLRQLQQSYFLKTIFSELQNMNKENKPLLIKIAPDLSSQEIEDIIFLAAEYKLNGIITSNTTLNRNILTQTNLSAAEKFGAGGLSGAPILKQNMPIVEQISRSGSSLKIIASGGIQFKSDLEQYKKAGAELFQIWSGFIYQGPTIVKKLLS